MNIRFPESHELVQEVERCWPLAQACWSRFLLLGKPNFDSEQHSIAQIDLRTRQVTLNAGMIVDKQLLGSVEAILAHEIGHHVRYPGTYQTQARMRLLERSLVPFEEYSFINLFTDLMINERLGRSLREPLILVYQAFSKDEAFHSSGWKQEPAFVFYLIVYEELWDLPPGTLAAKPGLDFAYLFPGSRAQAKVLVHNLFRMGPNVYTQFLYFLSIFLRYLLPLIEDKQPEALHGMQCGHSGPSAEDWGAAVIPSAAEQEAIRKAIAEGWFAKDQAERLDESRQSDNRISGLPGFGTADERLLSEVMASHYRQQAESLLIRPPAQRRMGELHAPTTLDEWEPGDAIQEIDWLSTLMLRGEVLGGAAPLKRIRVAEVEGQEAAFWQPRMEIYLDVSGSMPNPNYSINAMTLAAQILATGAIRAGGRVRAALYSGEPVLFWEWTRSETELSRFLMHYVGGGTSFPFEVLGGSCDDCTGDQPIRVIITDRDWDANFDARPGNRGIVETAAIKSSRFILLLHLPDPARVGLYRGLGATVVPVQTLDDFPHMAGELTHSLFPENRHEPI